MCGRYRLSRRKQLIQEYFDTADEVDWEPRYNIAPSQSIGIIRQDPAKPERRFSQRCFDLLSNRVRVGLRCGCSMQVREKDLLGKIDISSGNAVPIAEVRGGDDGIVRCKERLGGLLKYYEREAAWAFGRVNFPSLEARMSYLTIRLSHISLINAAFEFTHPGSPGQQRAQSNREQLNRLGRNP
jgi:hypothetical protein